MPKNYEKKYRVQVIQIGTDEQCQKMLAEVRRYIFSRLVGKIREEKVTVCAGGNLYKSVN